MKSAAEWKLLKIKELLDQGNTASVYLRGDDAPYHIEKIVKLEAHGVECLGNNKRIFFDPADIIAVMGYLPITDPKLQNVVNVC